jgi:hypothetical protein
VAGLARPLRHLLLLLRHCHRPLLLLLLLRGASQPLLLAAVARAPLQLPVLLLLLPPPRLP